MHRNTRYSPNVRVFLILFDKYRKKADSMCRFLLCGCRIFSWLPPVLPQASNTVFKMYSLCLGQEDLLRSSH